MKPNQQLSAHWITITTIYGAVAVIMGAFGSHVLKNSLNEVTMQWWKTAVFYHLSHTLLLLVVAFMMRFYQSRWLKRSALATAWGILLFSGSLYLMALTGFKWFGLITPIGGVGFILGWLFLSLSSRDILKNNV